MYTFIGSFVDSKLTGYYYYQYKRFHNIHDDTEEVLNLIEKEYNFNTDLAATPEEREHIFDLLIDKLNKLIGRGYSFLEYLLSYTIHIVAINKQNIYMIHKSYIPKEITEVETYDIQNFDKYMYLLRVKKVIRDEYIICTSMEKCNRFMNDIDGTGYEIYKISLNRPDSRFLMNTDYYDPVHKTVLSFFDLGKEYLDLFYQYKMLRDKWDGWYDFIMKGMLYEKYVYNINKELTFQGIMGSEQSTISEHDFNNKETLKNMFTNAYDPVQYIEQHYPKWEI